jgi:hypothetical protein
MAREEKRLKQTLEIVQSSLGYNELNITASDLRSLDNPMGNEVFGFVSQMRFMNVDRYIIWLVVEGKAYALNGATKRIILSLPWPREAPSGVWKQTGLNSYQATESVKIVFGS